MFQPSNSFGDPVAFRTIFFEEAQEHLANVEAILLRMDTDAPHPDDLNAIFRAVHSIKGSAAMLGCSEIAALTHLQENLLDLLRKDERPITADDVNAMLKAGDVLRLQVLHRRGSLADRTAEWPGLGPLEPGPLRLIVVPDGRRLDSLTLGRAPRWGSARL